MKIELVFYRTQKKYRHRFLNDTKKKTQTIITHAAQGQHINETFIEYVTLTSSLFSAFQVLQVYGDRSGITKSAK